MPDFVLFKSAGNNDAKEAREVCAGSSAGEMAIFDKAYVDFKHLYELLIPEDLYQQILTTVPVFEQKIIRPTLWKN